MIDKLEIRVEPEIPFTVDFEAEYAETRKMPTKLYKEKIPLRHNGRELILFRSCRFNASHKIVFVQTRNMTLGEVRTQIERIFDCNPMDLQVSRIDFAADIPGFSVDWARDHARIEHKRSQRERGSAKKGKTLYLGSGADQFRIYDKNAELRYSRARATRHLGSIGESGVCEISDGALLRVERQIRTGRMPQALHTFGDVVNNVSTFNPFLPVAIFEGGKASPSIVDYPFQTYLEGMGLRQLIRGEGIAKAWNKANARTGGNARRVFERLSDFIPWAAAGFTQADLSETYRESLHRQLTAGPAGACFTNSPESPKQLSCEVTARSSSENGAVG